MWTSPSSPSPLLVAVNARRVAELPLELARALATADRCAASDAVFDVVELARLPRPTLRATLDEAAIEADILALSEEELASRGEARPVPRPLEGMTVVSTRAAHQAAALAERLEACGARVVAIPAIAMHPPEDEARLDTAIRAWHTYRAAVFTSENGVARTFARVRALGLDARALAGLLVAAIGPGTAAALRREGVRADLVPSEHVGEALAATLIAALPEASRVAILRATEARDALPRLLRDAGHEVDVVPAYTTVRAFDVERLRAVADASAEVAITFTSASTATSVIEALRAAEALELLQRCTCVSIGPITTAAFADAKVLVHAEASPYTLDGLVAALVAHSSARRAFTGGGAPLP